MRDLSKDKHFCYHPFETLTITADGQAQPCPSWDFCDKYPIADLNQKEVTIDEIFASRPMEELRQHMLKGDRSPACRSCYRREESDMDSQRLRYARRRSISDTQTIKQIEINFSNQCNLACAMCNHNHSSGWYQQEKSLPESLRKDMEVNKSWPSKPFKHFSLSKKFVHSILDRLDTLEVLVIKGGEPLYDKNCLNLLWRISEIKPDLKIVLVSNITHVPQRTLDTLSRLNNVQLNISVDGVGKTYEWIRGFPFHRISDNYKKISAMMIKEVHLNVTVSIYNVLNVVDTVKYFKDLAPNNYAVSFNFVVEPFMSALTLLPDTYKDMVANDMIPQLRQIGCVPPDQIDSYLNYVTKDYKTVRNALTTSKANTIRVFKDYTQWLNGVRGMQIQEEAHYLKSLYTGWLNSHDRQGIRKRKRTIEKSNT